MRRIDGLGITAEVLENPFNDCWRLNAGDDVQDALVPRSVWMRESGDTQVPAALPAGLHVNGEHPLEALCP
jgi:hypothetical protein